MDRNSNTGSVWRICGHTFPKSEIVFFTQIIILYVVICTSLGNLTIGTDNNTLWTSLLGTSLGSLMPNPRIKHRVQ